MQYYYPWVRIKYFPLLWDAIQSSVHKYNGLFYQINRIFLNIRLNFITTAD